jgi:hypothetical protein
MVAAGVGLVCVLGTAGITEAHCDALDGPVVKAARAALEAGDVTPVLRWVPATSEPEVKEAFARTRKVRSLGPDAGELADRWFLETVVRIHRLSEGAGFDGLKPAGGIDPVIQAADASVDKGTGDALAHRLTAALEEGLRHRFDKVLAAAREADQSVAAGRAFVAAYVDYVHFVENAHKAIVAEGGAHDAHVGR